MRTISLLTVFFWGYYASVGRAYGYDGQRNTNDHFEYFAQRYTELSVDFRGESFVFNPDLESKVIGKPRSRIATLSPLFSFSENGFLITQSQNRISGFANFSASHPVAGYVLRGSPNEKIDTKQSFIPMRGDRGGYACFKSNWEEVSTPNGVFFGSGIDGFTVFSLPIGEEGNELICIYPYSGMQIAQLEAEMSASRLVNVMRRLRPLPFFLEIPNFKIQSSIKVGNRRGFLPHTDPVSLEYRQNFELGPFGIGLSASKQINVVDRDFPAGGISLGNPSHLAGKNFSIPPDAFPGKPKQKEFVFFVVNAKTGKVLLGGRYMGE